MSRWTDPRDEGLTPDVYIAMGKTAELVAAMTGTSRQDQDEWALQSQLRAAAAIDAGYFAGRSCPIRQRDGTMISADDGPRIGTTLDGARRAAIRSSGRAAR